MKLSDIPNLIRMPGTEFPQMWNAIPLEYQEDFKSWVADYKQQSWEGMWQHAWECYDREYLAQLIERFAQEGKQ